MRVQYATVWVIWAEAASVGTGYISSHSTDEVGTKRSTCQYQR